jgi:signal transduction histidine kinase
MEGQSREFESRSGIRVQFVPDIAEEIEMSFSPAIAIGMYRVFQESLNNVAKHARAKNVNVFLEVIGSKIVFRLCDDGIGFNVAEVAGKKTLGLVGIRERALMLNGEYTISSLPGEGTTIMLSVPLT